EGRPAHARPTREGTQEVRAQARAQGPAVHQALSVSRGIARGRGPGETPALPVFRVRGGICPPHEKEGVPAKSSDFVGSARSTGSSARARPRSTPSAEVRRAPPLVPFPA